MLSVLAVIAYLLTQFFWFLFNTFHLGTTWGLDIASYDIFTSVSGALFFVSVSVILTYKLRRKNDLMLKGLKLEKVTFFTQKIYEVLKKAFIMFFRGLYSSRKTVFLILAFFLIILIFSFAISAWFFSIDYEPTSNQPQSNEQNDNYDRTVPATGNLAIEGLDIYGGDVIYDAANDTVYVDWGELTLGSYENVSFYVKSNSNTDVTLDLNVTSWQPLGIDEYIFISWDYNGTVLPPASELFVTLTLKVASSADFISFLVENAITNFGFDINVYASSI
jgi:hypothetical protein